MKTKLILFFLIIFTFIYSQNYVELINSSHIKRCGFNEANPNLNIKKRNNFNTWILENQKKFNRNSRTANEKIILPVVVHVIHNGENISNSTKNITDQRIKSQIDVLNQDYQRIQGTPGYNTNPVGSDLQIEFKLATKNPDDSQGNGINRINYGVDKFTTHKQINQMKAQTIWNPEEYINIWVIEFTDDKNITDSVEGTLGVAQFPSDSTLNGLFENEGSEFTDGITIDWRAFGNSSTVGGIYFRSYNLGRTTTHEMGHFLGLLHIFDDNQNDCIDNDYCQDTPIQSTPNSGECNSRDSCPQNLGLDMIENYLDYSSDECMNIFTNDQKYRVETVLKNSPRRKNLMNSKALDTQNYKNTANITTNIIYNQKTLKIDEFNIIFNEFIDSNIKIYSINGNLILNENYKNNLIKLYTNNLSPGIYFLKINTNKDSVTKRFLIK